MAPSIIAHKLPKKGNAADECEDAFECSTEHLRFAVADGATESSFSDRWAESLVRQYVTDPPFGNPPTEDALQLWLVPQQAEWHAGINWSGLAWFALEKAERGAYAALLGLEFSRDATLWQRLVSRPLSGEELSWTAFAVGDTCLFQVRGNELKCSFPLTKSEEFGSRPILLASNALNNQSALKGIRSEHGGCKPGDLFFLATDALAKWFLAQYEAGAKPWEVLLELRAEADFAGFVDKARADQSLKNDDTTLVILDWSG